MNIHKTMIITNLICGKFDCIIATVVGDILTKNIILN